MEQISSSGLGAKGIQINLCWLYFCHCKYLEKSQHFIVCFFSCVMKLKLNTTVPEYIVPCLGA